MGNLLVRKIFSIEILDYFLTSSSFTDLFQFVLQLSASIKNKSSAQLSDPSKFIFDFGEFLRDLQVELDNNEYFYSSRYGNPLFRDWVSATQLMSKNLMKKYLGEKLEF